MGNFFKDLAGTALGGPEYVAHRLLGDDFKGALGHTFADRLLGAPFSLMGHAMQARQQQYGCMPNYNGCDSPYSNYCCNSRGNNRQMAWLAQESYAAGVNDGFYAGYQAAFAQMAGYNSCYGAWN